MSSDKIKYLSLSEAAAELGYGSTSTLRMLCRKKCIAGATKIGAYWAIPSGWVNEQKTAGKTKTAGGPRGKGIRKTQIQGN
ncbi:MAG: hypothetical protein LBV80_07830 [Deltaproteobacteria bacterium]|jgi:hypothetical protein|nr:hypothetical protein [Deltaproteobacteria bacterium]